MAPLAPTKKRRVAFETDFVVNESIVKVQGKKRKLLQPLRKTEEDRRKASADASTPVDGTRSFKVIAGSYEKILYGLEGHYDKESGKATLKPIFIFPAHLSCIKSVAASPNGGKWLATGSVDEVIKVWDLRRRKEVGGLVQHEGSITQLCFPTRSHMFSASEDGTITVFQVKDWVPVSSLKGHKGRVNSIAIHPSLKVALSVGKDKVLRMWDLAKGKSVASMKIGKEGEVIRWSTNGNHFAVLSGSSIEVYSTDMKLKRLISHPIRQHDLRFLPLADGRECLLVAAEDKKVSVYDFGGEDSSASSEPPFAAFIGHTNRVKAIDLLTLKLGDKTTKTLLVTVSSDGLINLHDTTVLHNHKLSLAKEVLSIEPIGSYNTNGTRLTCVTLAEDGVSSPEPVAGAKRAIDDKEDEDSESGQELGLA